MARENFTAGRLDKFKCPAGTTQAFKWDLDVPGLALRVTANGARSFIFQSRLEGKTLRVTIGDRAHWTIPDAREEARRLQRLLDRKIDPRIERAETAAEQAAKRDAANIERARLEVAGLDAWSVYLDERRGRWGKRNYADHAAMAAEGGEPRLRAKAEKTKPGPLFSLLSKPLASIDAEEVQRWIARETNTRPVRASLAFRHLRAFVNWCTEHPEYRDIVNADACKGRRTREKLAKPAAKDDALQREQLAAWFAEVRKLSPAMGAYLQVLLLTGCRAGEALDIKWSDVDFQWQALRIRDKVEGERVIPLTPYVATLLRELKARNTRCPEPPRHIKRDAKADEAFRRDWKPSPWVFVARVQSGERMKDASHAHRRALTAAGLPHITLHGLRRSFGTLAEWVECPVGVVAQIQGHKPSAIAEKHYRVRPLDLLRMWHTRIEAWILSEAGIEQPNAEEAGAAPTLRVVKGASAA